MRLLFLRLFLPFCPREEESGFGGTAGDSELRSKKLQGLTKKSENTSSPPASSEKQVTRVKMTARDQYR